MFKASLFGVMTYLVVCSTAYAGGCDITKNMGEPITQKVANTYNLCRLSYQVLYSGKTKTPIWVAEDIQRDNVLGKMPRSNDFSEDSDIPAQFRATLLDYNKSGYARGHMAPAANNRTNALAEKQTYLLTNIAPQVGHCNNSGIWSQLEEIVRDWAVHYGELYVVTGTVYGQNYTTIGNGVGVPNAFYKVVYNPSLKKSVGFLIPNQELCKPKLMPHQKKECSINQFSDSPILPFCTNHLRNFAVTQTELEKLTGIKFFPYMSGYDRTNKLWQ